MHSSNVVVDQLVAAPGPDPEQLAIAAEVSARLRAAIAQALTPRQRQVVLLRYRSDLSYAAIGATLGISDVAALRCHDRAIAVLRIRLVD